MMVVALSLAVAFSLGSCGGKSDKPAKAGQEGKSESGAKPEGEVDAKTFSYAVGAQLGEMFREQSVEFSFDDLAKGLKDAYAGNSEMEVQQMQQNIQLYMEANEKRLAAERLVKSNAFLDSVEKQPGVQRDSSGLVYLITEQGEGGSPIDTSWVEIEYTGRLADGEVFDASERHGGPAVLNVGNVIEGWKIAIPMLKEGGKGTLYIPPSLGYGERGRPGIPGNAVMVFDVHLVHILNAKEVEAYKKGEYKQK